MKKEIIINGKKKEKIENINIINKETIELNLESKKRKKKWHSKNYWYSKRKFKSSKENNNENKEENNNI